MEVAWAMVLGRFKDGVADASAPTAAAAAPARRARPKRSPS
jgi:hypothetical protein